MKSTSRLVILAIGIVAISFLTSCKKEDISEFKLVGSWKYKERTVVKYVDEIIESTYTTSTIPNGTITFNSDGTGFYANNKGVVYSSFTWTFWEGILTSKGVNLHNGEEHSELSVINPNIMVITRIEESVIENNGTNIVYTDENYGLHTVYTDVIIDRFEK